ncbi:MAG: endonuclease/exonuclease/phosphatase family protein [Planctomycetota bacterium]|nr:endonuclease/exonuclease/phosphatase family protein [Planctomycetota bacterium]MDA1177730.1 endonuclease/exonuclease/phosphatase family protein [Planctomycetota bacterium]
MRDRTNYLVQRLAIAGIAMAAGTLALASGCDPKITSLVKRLQDRQSRSTGDTAGHEGVVAPNPDQVRIGTFNLGVFGPSKSKDSQAISTLARIVRAFDVMAVQEIRSVHAPVLDVLLEEINRSARLAGSSSLYDYVIGPPIGRSNSKEQYAFIFDANRVAIDPSNVYTLLDPQDLLHREPFVARFVTRPLNNLAPFTFTLVNIHTDPHDADKEINLLDDILQVVARDGSGEDDVILLGDLYLPPGNFDQLAQVQDMHWVVDDTPTNTRRDKVYDNICYLGFTTVEYQRGGVLDFQKAYSLTQQQALEVSDHLPVWADFSAHEGGVNGSIARQTLTRQYR